MIGARVTDTLHGRTGTIVAVDAEHLDVLVQWGARGVTTLRPDDIRAGRYTVVLP